MYLFNTTYLSEKLVPPALRQVRILAYIRVLLAPIQIKWNDFLEYINGSNYLNWDGANPYVVGDRVKYGYAIYEALQASAGEIPYNNTDYWLLINKDFVGLDARRVFNSHKMVFEYTLNLYLNTTPTTIPLIYTTRNVIDANGFYMGDSGYGELGEMAKSNAQNDFMGNSYSLNQYAMTIYVPAALYTSLASTSADREARVRNIADRYVPAGIQYNVTTY